MRPERVSDGRHRTKEPKSASRTHWVVLAAFVVVVAVSLLVQGYTRHLYDTAADGAGPPPGPSGQVPSVVSGGGPGIDAAGIDAAGGPRPAGVKSRTIALTFDDGPDPVWTPKVLEVLARNHVHATFFVVGTKVADNPEILRQIVADGHEVGVHTFTHADLGLLPATPRCRSPRRCAAPASTPARSPSTSRRCWCISDPGSPTTRAIPPSERRWPQWRGRWRRPRAGNVPCAPHG